MCGSIFVQICAVAFKRRIFSAPECVLAVQGRSGSSKVDDFGTNRKRVEYIWLPISRSLWLWAYLAPFSRYGDLLAKNWLFLLHFCYPSLIRRPRSLCCLWFFFGDVNHEETRVMGLSSSENHMIVAGVVLAWYRTVTDGQTDGRSDRIYHYLIQRFDAPL